MVEWVKKEKWIIPIKCTLIIQENDLPVGQCLLLKGCKWPICKFYIHFPVLRFMSHYVLFQRSSVHVRWPSCSLANMTNHGWVPVNFLYRECWGSHQVDLVWFVGKFPRQLAILLLGLSNSGNNVYWGHNAQMWP